MARSMQGVSKLLNTMKKMSREVNDYEICRRLETLINTEKEDFSVNLSRKIFESPSEVEPRDIPEPFTQYVMHYIYMLKRESRLEEKAQEEGGLHRPTRKKKGSISKKSGAKKTASNRKKSTAGIAKKTSRKKS